MKCESARLYPMIAALGAPILHSIDPRACRKWASGINERRGSAVLIFLCLYVVALWLVFSKFKLVRW